MRLHKESYGTPFPASKRGSNSKSARVSTDFEAAWYARGGNHNGEQYKKAFFAHEVHFLAQAHSAGTPDQPSLVLGMSMGKPGTAPRRHAVEATQALIGDETLPKKSYIGDRLFMPAGYTEDFAIPLRKANFRMVADLTKDSMGLKGTYEGALNIDGQ